MENSKRRKNTYKTIENERLRKSTEYKEWRLKVFQRDDFKCRKCENNKILHPHHIKSFAKFPKLRFDVNNGVTLCDDCHGKIHGIDYKRNKKKLICKYCNIQFPVKDGHYNHQFCSKRCAYDYRKGKPSAKRGRKYPHLQKYPNKICPICGIVFKAVVNKARNQKFCSVKCYRIYWKKNVKHKFNRWGKKAEKINV